MRTRSKAALALAALVLAVLAAQPSAAKDYHFPEVLLDVTVRADGGFEVREMRTFEFDGDFSFAYYDIEKRSSSGERVEITDLVVGEGGTEYMLGSPRILDDERTPGMYYADYDHEGRYARLKWFYRADDERRRFDISYTIRDAVIVHDDFAVLYWKFVGDSWTVPTSRVEGVIHLPAGADIDRVRAWLHAPLTSEYIIQDAQTVTFWVERLPSEQFVELRVLFPPELVPRATRRVGGDVWTSVFEEEGEWVEDANARRVAAQQYVARRQRLHRAGGYAGIGVALAVFLA